MDVMATLASKVVSEIHVSPSEVTRIREQLDLDTRFCRLLSDLLRDDERKVGPAIEPLPRSIEPLLEMVAAKAAEVVQEAAITSETRGQLASLFNAQAERAWTSFIHAAELARALEIQADFSWSISDWVRVLSGDVATASRRRTLAEPLPVGVDELYRPWKPFRLIDEIVEHRPGEKVVALKTVKSRECHDASDFEDEPMSAALLLEALGHAAVLAIKGPTAEGPPPSPAKLSTRFRQAAHAGDRVTLTATVKKSGHGLWVVDGSASRDADRLAEAEFTFTTL
jgi:3-hydroxymyristoyl/3-hydroxydecanoyl-(acyl carrier protein) dehydratase